MVCYHSDMTEIIPEKYQPSREIRTNHRFSTFEGALGDKKVFVKFAVDPELKDRLPAEAAGLRAMRQLEPNETLYRVPSVLELTDDYIATEWAEGTPMANDFEEMNSAKIMQDLSYLVRLYAFIDQHPDSGAKLGDIVNNAIDKNIANLQTLEYGKYVNEKLVAELAEYIRANAGRVETRTTNGDLQPGNIMVADGIKPTVIDCESYRDAWPRHYNIVNFVFNYGTEYPALRGELKDMLVEYGHVIGVNPDDDVVSFNISAAVRSLQIIEERLSGGDFSLEIKNHVEATIHNILNGQLFTK